MGLFDIFTNDNANAARDAQIAGLTSGYNAASGAINQGSDFLKNYYTQALQPFLANYKTGTAGVGALTDALGITGDPSKVAARFAQTPGYQFQLQQGNENVLRNASRTGSLNSGGTNVDLTKFSQGLADTTYNNYVQSLMPFLGYQSGAAGGIGTVNTGLGNQLNNNQGSLANLGWQYNTGVGNANANAILAGNQATGNMWNAIQGGVGLAATLLSDARAKDDIEPVGELYDGTGIYRYRYKGDATPRIGVLAQEVEQRNPAAVVEIDGWKAVDYGRATNYAAELAKFLKAA